MATILNAFQRFFHVSVLPEHNNPAFFCRWLDNLRNLETQLIVAPGKGVPVEGRRNTWTDEREQWYNIRWPKNAMAEPYWKDRELEFLLENHWLGIGTTWWDWINRQSVGVGFDFDEITSHAPGTGIELEQLEKVRQAACALPYVDVIRSTGGKGLHLYVWFAEDSRPLTANHSEHAAIARVILGKLSTDAQFDFGSHLDVCGGNMWVAHQKMFGTQGFTQLKEATEYLTRDDISPNWRDQIPVVQGKATKVRVIGVTDEGEDVDEQDPLTELTTAHPKVPLDATHRRIIMDLEATGASCVWVPDHHLLQTHTCALKAVSDQWTERGQPMRGFFETLSPGRDMGQPNCLAGDTPVVTREGVKPISELAGRSATIITKHGAWVEAPFKSYGTQPVYRITLKNRRGIVKVIRATGDHRWFVCRQPWGYRKTKVNFGNRVEKVTLELQPDDILVQTPARFDKGIPSVVGIQHGLVWGDGTVGGERRTAELPLFGNKDAALLKFFVGHPQRPITNSIGGTLITNLPKHFKSLVPLHYDKPYLYGWLAGYFAADGCVSEDGICILRSTDQSSIEHVRQVAHILGIETTPITSRLHTSGYNPDSITYTTTLKRRALREDFFLIDEHRERFLANKNKRDTQSLWRVVSVEPAGEEEVFCCTVPETGCFCLEDFILTGNCFLIPKNDGAFLAFRFGQGTVEHDLWQQDRQGWTYISYNKRPNLQSAALAFSGSELENNKGFHFDQTADAQKAVESLGSKLLLPPGNNYLDRAVTLRKNTDGRLVVELERRDNDSGFDGWNGSKKNKWIKIFNIVVEANSEEDDYTRYDTLIRSCRTPGAADAGWRVHIKEGGWVKHPRENVASVLSLVAPPGLAMTQILGKAIINQWLLVCKPFHPEYPGGRQWNLGAPQLAHKPAQLEADEMPQHPHWDRVLEHCGEHLTPVIRETAWCRDWGIFNGKGYLTAWISCLLKEPFEPLPYLFMYGPQNSGKSIFHEAVSLLVTGGIVKADRALTSPGDFNGELANAVIGVVDEVNIAKSGSTVYNKIKEWTTSQHISIHAKYQQVYQQRNCLHFVQTANSRDSCPIFPGDTRITAMYVAPLVEEIPKPALMQALESEAPHFMATLMDATYPSSGTRLRLPILDTAGKEQAADANRDPLEEFLAETCHYVPGAKVPYKEFSDRFFETLTPIEQTYWDRRRLRQSIPEEFPVGLSTKGRTFVGNLSWEHEVYPDDAIPYTIKGRCLCLEEKAC